MIYTYEMGENKLISRLARLSNIIALLTLIISLLVFFTGISELPSLSIGPFELSTSEPQITETVTPSANGDPSAAEIENRISAIEDKLQTSNERIENIEELLFDDPLAAVNLQKIVLENEALNRSLDRVWSIVLVIAGVMIALSIQLLYEKWRSEDDD